MIFVSGGTGYLGIPLVERLLANGHSVRVLTRKGSEHKVPRGAESSYHLSAGGADTFIHLLGTPRPAPWKGHLFRTVDLPHALASITAAQQAKLRHFIYVSVAHPAPVMKAYMAVRCECETALRESGLAHTILRPWYVLGPGHWWPYSLIPFYWVCERLPATREPARRLGLVTRAQMIKAMVWAVENPSPRSRILEVPDIRRGCL